MTGFTVPFYPEDESSIILQCSLDNLTLANLHFPDNLHTCSGHNSLPLRKTYRKIGSDNSHARIICTIFLRIWCAGSTVHISQQLLTHAEISSRCLV